MAARQFAAKHNQVVTIDRESVDAAPYLQLLNFLVRSRVHHILTHNPPLLLQYIRQFWNTLHQDTVDQTQVLRATVNGQQLTFSAETLRQILQLGTAEQEDGPIDFSVELRRGAFQRMGYSLPIAAASYKKSGLFGQWRYLAHLILVCLAPKKSGTDSLTSRLQSAMIALTYNKPFSFSGWFFAEFVYQITAPNQLRFLLYPRFVMMIIRHFLPILPPSHDVAAVSVVDKRLYADCLAHSTRRPENERPEVTALFGALIDEAYQPPANDGWLDDEAPGPVGEAAQGPQAQVQDPAEQVPDQAAQVPVQDEEVQAQAAQEEHLDAQVAAQEQPRDPTHEALEDIFAYGQGAQPDVTAELIRDILHPPPPPRTIFDEIEDYVPPPPASVPTGIADEESDSDSGFEQDLQESMNPSAGTYNRRTQPPLQTPQLRLRDEDSDPDFDLNEEAASAEEERLAVRLQRTKHRRVHDASSSASTSSPTPNPTTSTPIRPQPIRPPPVLPTTTPISAIPISQTPVHTSSTTAFTSSTAAPSTSSIPPPPVSEPQSQSPTPQTAALFVSQRLQALEAKYLTQQGQLLNVTTWVYGLQKENAELKTRVTAQDALLAEQRSMIAAQHHTIEAMQDLLAKLLKDQQVQGETSCRGDELKEARRDDEEDDPSARDREPADLSKHAAKVQGESSS